MLIGNLSAQSLMIAVSGIVIVFLMLAVLSIIIVFISRAVGSIAGGMSAVSASAGAPARMPVPVAAPVPAPAAAPVQLSGVNELTAACIMAIVSDELGTTPDQLVFKSIRAL